MTPATRVRTIDLYRSEHRIVPIEGRRAGLIIVKVCATDRIRVHPRRDGTYFHDPTEVREAAGGNR